MAPRPSEPHLGLEAERFEALVAEQAPPLYRFALSLAREPAAAEDLVQETFARALERRGSFRGEASLATWLRRILHNLAVDRARRHSHEVLVGEVEQRWRDDAYTVDSDAVIERAQTREELEEALVRLPFIYRSAVLLHDVEGWSLSELAAALGIGLAAAKQRLRRGHMMLLSSLASGSERQAALAGVPLRCWEARREISSYLVDALSAEQRQQLERHLETCPTCPPLYAALVGIRTELGGLRDPDSVISPDLTQRVLARPHRRCAYSPSVGSRAPAAGRTRGPRCRSGGDRGRDSDRSSEASVSGVTKKDEGSPPWQLPAGRGEEKARSVAVAAGARPGGAEPRAGGEAPRSQAPCIRSDRARSRAS